MESKELTTEQLTMMWTALNALGVTFERAAFSALWFAIFHYQYNDDFGKHTKTIQARGTTIQEAAIELAKQLKII